MYSATPSLSSETDTMQPLFITFEGLDGSGKSTHLKRAVQWLRKHGEPVCQSHEPGGTPLGDAIRSLFLDSRWGKMDGRVEALLVFASRRQHLLELIEPQLAAGTHVICDRFTDSSLAYQGSGRSLPDGWIESLDQLAIEARRPDHTLLFDLPAESAYARGRSASRRERGDVDRLDDEDLAFYGRVRQRYLQLVERQPERFQVIDSDGEKEHTWLQVEAALRRLFPHLDTT